MCNHARCCGALASCSPRGFSSRVSAHRVSHQAEAVWVLLGCEWHLTVFVASKACSRVVLAVPGWIRLCLLTVLPGCLCTQILRDGRLLVGVSSYFLPDTGQLWEHQAGLNGSRIVLNGQCVSLRLRDLLLQSCSCSLLPAASPSPALGSDHSWNS